jgi:hypothetical protein
MRAKLWTVSILLFVVLLLVIYNSYGLFENNATALEENPVGGWTINLNDILISETGETDINVDEFVYEDSTTINNGYIAPGRSGYFDLILDPSGTDVAIQYEITFNLDDAYEDNITYSVDMLSGDSATQVDENTYIGVITLDDIDEGETISLRVHVSWVNDETLNDSDTQLGIVLNNKIVIPINIKLIQYLGE